MTAKPAPTEVDIHELIAGRWSPRAFSEKPVERAQLHRLLEAARWAPSSNNLQPWRSSRSTVIATKPRSSARSTRSCRATRSGT